MSTDAFRRHPLFTIARVSSPVQRKVLSSNVDQSNYIDLGSQPWNVSLERQIDAGVDPAFLPFTPEFHIRALAEMRSAILHVYMKLFWLMSWNVES